MRYSFTVPYEQTQIMKASGLFVCEIEAESKEEALDIFEQNAFWRGVSENNVAIDLQELKLEKIVSHECVYDINATVFE